MENINVTRNTLVRSDYRSHNAFVDPRSGQMYRTNVLLSRKKLEEVKNQKDLVAFHEPKFGSDGKIGVVYLSGATARIPEYKWKQVKSVPVQIKKANKA
jgi:hypothetical protein